MASTPAGRADSVFIDASILVAAAISPGGRARELLLACIRGEVSAEISGFALEETERNLRKKARSALPALTMLRAAFRVTVDPPASLVLDVARVIEVKDAPIIAGAIHARARFLATYDRRHLLGRREIIEQHYGIVVAIPGEILTLLGR
jgi:predicted nucleic acid-binding protein